MDDSMNQSHDEWIVVRCQLGERAAFDALIERWHEPLWKYAVRVTGDADTAADILQEVWLRVFRGLIRLRDTSKFRAWVFGIARRVLMDRLRSKYRQPPTDDIDLDTVAAIDVEDDIEEELALMHAELAGLPAVERDVLVLFYLRELSLSEIADVAGVPVGTVKSRLFRARRLLRSHIENRKGLT
jgi:RNA polymerase sigma-70 factor (ECF subfamily)